MNKWVQINKAFFNTELMTAFYWSAGRLWVYWLGEGEPDWYEDPDRENYHRLCNRLLVTPVREDEQNGKS